MPAPGPVHIVPYLHPALRAEREEDILVVPVSVARFVVGCAVSSLVLLLVAGHCPAQDACSDTWSTLRWRSQLRRESQLRRYGAGSIAAQGEEGVVTAAGISPFQDASSSPGPPAGHEAAGSVGDASEAAAFVSASGSPRGAASIASASGFETAKDEESGDEESPLSLETVMKDGRNQRVE